MDSSGALSYFQQHHHSLPIQPSTSPPLDYRIALHSFNASSFASIQSIFVLGTVYHRLSPFCWPVQTLFRQTIFFIFPSSAFRGSIRRGHIKLSQCITHSLITSTRPTSSSFFLPCPAAVHKSFGRRRRPSVSLCKFVFLQRWPFLLLLKSPPFTHYRALPPRSHFSFSKPFLIRLTIWQVDMGVTFSISEAKSRNRPQQ